MEWYRARRLSREQGIAQQDRAAVPHSRPAVVGESGATVAPRFGGVDEAASQRLTSATANPRTEAF